ncbi:uncharacterized protein J3D65DRAFT_196605 [Phyllosticta citribraziliensis]|uniref:Uncharacterized protein n=1 Tax=Phyllosticta citribraziliensis TaxID=989973 RepID=A0ABR1M380_9PEZI
MPENGESIAIPWFRYYAEALWMVVKGRKGRHLFLTVLLATVTIVLLWSYSNENLSPAAISGHRADDELWRAENDRHVHATASAEAVSQTPSSTNEANSNKTDNDNAATATATPKLEPLPFTAKNGPTFRLLIPAAESDANFCRSILSTMLLDYPPPTILGYNSRDQTASIVGAIYAHLEDPHICDDDLILVADGYRAWFQLPSSVLVRQYQRVTAAANQRLKKTYGVLRGGGQGAEKLQRFRQTVLFAADTHCWHYTDNDVACDAVPDAPGVWERANTAKNASAAVFNPKFLSSGIVMGPARDLRAVFAAASKKSTGAGGAHDLQHALQTMYSEQEQAREAVRRANLGAAGRVREWLYSTVYGYGQSQFLRGRRSSSSASGGGLGMSRRNLTIEAGRDYEFAIGLDYGSALFQSMSAPHSFNGDVEFLAAADALAFPDPSMHALPPALAALPSPFFLPPADKASEDIPDNATTPLTLTPGLDDLPVDLPWSALPLARNLLTGAAPASLHFPPRLWASGGDGIGARSLHASYSSPQTNNDGTSSSPPSNPQANHPSTPHHRLSPLYKTPQSPKDSSPSSSTHSDTADAEGIDPGTDTTTPPTFAHLDPRDSVYRHLWFVRYARALLRRHMRRTTFHSLLDNEIAAVEESGSSNSPDPLPNSPNSPPSGSSKGEATGEPDGSPKASPRWQTQRDRDLHFDRRGGAGGVWTQQGEWLAWGDVCRGMEEEVFAADDGWGEWGEERASRGMFEDARKAKKMPVARPADGEKNENVGQKKEGGGVKAGGDGGEGETQAAVARPADQEKEQEKETVKEQQKEGEAKSDDAEGGVEEHTVWVDPPPAA